IGGAGRCLQPEIPIGTGGGIDVDRGLAPLLCEEKPLRALRTRLARRDDRAAIGDRLVTQEDILVCSEAGRPVHVIGQGAIYVILVAGVAAAVVSRVDTAAGRHVVECRAADRPSSRRAAVDVLPIAEFVVVPRRVVALRGVKYLQAVLAARVD